jgi:D-tyrosyl-tRNA(Tyr) deacylase
MRFVCQRVKQAEVKVNDQSVGRIDKGLLVYLSVGNGDTENDAQFMADKLVNLRIFADQAGKPVLAQQLYEKVAALIARQGVPVEQGIFGEYMQVSSVNDGPVTFILDSSKLF